MRSLLAQQWVCLLPRLGCFVLVRLHLFCGNSTLSFWKSSVLLACGRIFFLCGDIRVWCSELWFWVRGLGLGLSVCFYMQVRISMLRSFGGRSSLTCCGFCCEWDVGSTGSCPALCASHGPRGLIKPGASDSRLSRFCFPQLFHLVYLLVIQACCEIGDWESQCLSRVSSFF
jgi:hypothetical protein